MKLLVMLQEITNGYLLTKFSVDPEKDVEEEVYFSNLEEAMARLRAIFEAKEETL